MFKNKCMYVYILTKPPPSSKRVSLPAQTENNTDRHTFSDKQRKGKSPLEYRVLTVTYVLKPKSNIQYDINLNQNNLYTNI